MSKSKHYFLTFIQCFIYFQSAHNYTMVSIYPLTQRFTECSMHFISNWASLVAQLVKNPPAMRETWVQFLGWEDPLEKGTATQIQFSGLENSTDCIVHGVTQSQTRLSNFQPPFRHPVTG